MIYYWTRFLPKYPHALVYMLQASGYDIPDYIAWLARVSDFRNVNRRRSLDYTIKAKLLLIIAYFMIASVFSLALAVVYLGYIESNYYILSAGVVLFLLCPWFSPYLMIIPLAVVHKIIQAPRRKIMVKRARSIIANHPALKIAVAGSYGKTTAKEVIATVLGEGKKVDFTPGNMNTMIGVSRFIQTLKGDEEVLIFELGEGKVGDVQELCDLIGPDIGVITGINEAHLSSFGSLDRTVATIFELRDYLGDKPLYENIENKLVKANIKPDDKLAYSRHGVHNWKVEFIETTINGTNFKLTKGKKSINVNTGLLGEHNVGIIAVAVDIADSLGMRISQIEAGIQLTKPFEHRLEPRQMNGAWIIDDTYNGNSDGIEVGLTLLRQIDAKRKVYVTPGLVEQGDKTREVHEKIGRQIANVADVVYLMDNSVTDYIKAGLDECGFRGELNIINNPLEFYTHLDQYIVGGDVVLMQNDWPDNYA